MRKKIITALLTATFLVSFCPTVKAEYPTCTYFEGMFLCYQNGRLKSVYCNYRDSDSKIEACQNRIRENHKYKKYFRNKWKKHCEDSAQKRHGEYCKTLNEKFLFYKNEFLNIFLEEMNY